MRPDCVIRGMSRCGDWCLRIVTRVLGHSVVFAGGAVKVYSVPVQGASTCRQSGWEFDGRLTTDYPPSTGLRSFLVSEPGLGLLRLDHSSPWRGLRFLFYSFLPSTVITPFSSARLGFFTVWTCMSRSAGPCFAHRSVTKVHRWAHAGH